MTKDESELFEYLKAAERHSPASAPKPTGCSGCAHAAELARLQGLLAAWAEAVYRGESWAPTKTRDAVFTEAEKLAFAAQRGE